MTGIGIPLADERRAAAAEELQGLLTDLVDLSLQGKQAHWNATGRPFLTLHQQLDELVADTRTWVDALAERIVTLGRSPDGRAHTVAAATRLEAFPEGFVHDDKLVDVVVGRLETLVECARESADRLGPLDLVSQDLVIEILRGLEKHLWMLQAQLA